MYGLAVRVGSGDASGICYLHWVEMPQYLTVSTLSIMFHVFNRFGDHSLSCEAKKYRHLFACHCMRAW